MTDSNLSLLHKLAYDFVENNFGRAVVHSGFSDDLVALMMASQQQPISAEIKELKDELFKIRRLAHAVVDLHGGPSGDDAIQELEDYLEE